MVFDFIRRMQSTREEARATRESIERQRMYEAQQQRRAKEERQAQIAGVRVITGELKHRYVLVDTLSAFGLYIAQPGQDYDPTEATRRATYDLQSQAVAMGADAVIHARFEIIRYTESRGVRPIPLPAYEVHAFGTAVRVVGPPADWPDNSEWDYNP